MTLPAESLTKLDALPKEKLSVVIQVIEQLSESPVNKFRRLRANGLQNPMTDDEIDDFVASVRKKRHDSSN